MHRANMELHATIEPADGRYLPIVEADESTHLIWFGAKTCDVVANFLVFIPVETRQQISRRRTLGYPSLNTILRKLIQESFVSRSTGCTLKSHVEFIHTALIAVAILAHLVWHMQCYFAIQSLSESGSCP